MNSMDSQAEQAASFAISSEEARRIDQENMQAIFAAAPVGMLLLDEENMIVNSNAEIARLVGIEHAQFIRQRCGDGLGCVHSFEDERGCGFSPSCGECQLCKGLQEVLQSGNSIHGAEMQYTTLADGQEHHFWLNVSAKPVLLEGVKHVVAAIDEITERKRVETEQLMSRWTNELIINTLPVNIFWKDTNLVYQGCSELFARSAGFTAPKDIIGKDDFQMIWQDQADLYRSDDRMVIESGCSKLHIEESLMTTSSTITILTNKIPLRDSNGKINGILGSFIDITAIKQTESELINAKEKAEESDHIKSAFLANMSHEIRTPMNGILGFTELLKEPHLADEEQQQYISMIEKSGDRMLNIINDIINISKIEAGAMEVAVSATNINEQIEYIYNFFKPEVEQKGMQLSFKNTLPAKAAVIATDREKVYAVLLNLVKNAIKFTPSGSIEFGYEKKGELLEFFVKDTGIGIPLDKQSAVFDRFVQLNFGNRRAFQGAGLGLAISKAYVEMLGGRIWEESEEGKGTVFYFTIPYNAATAEKSVIENAVQADIPADETKDKIKALKILIVEDDEKSKMLIAIAVKRFSLELLEVETGVDAIEACRNNPDIDLVLMDIEMGRMNGYEATRQIRKFNKEVVIIAQTAYALKGDREKAVAAGCNDYIAKPYNRTSLTALLRKFF